MIMISKKAIKMSVDVLMTVFLLFLMGYQFWGMSAHEWIGFAMFALFILHHILNLNWHKNLFKGKYTPIRTVILIVDILTLLSMLALMYSGISMSRFNIIAGNLALARKLHILGAFWGYVLMSLHLGLHWNMILTAFAKKRKTQPTKAHKISALVFSIAVAVYGIYVFAKRNFAAYLFLKNEFVFMDYTESKMLFYLDYLALMGLCIFIAHYGSRFIKKIQR